MEHPSTELGAKQQAAIHHRLNLSTPPPPKSRNRVLSKSFYLRVSANIGRSYERNKNLYLSIRKKSVFHEEQEGMCRDQSERLIQGRVLGSLLGALPAAPLEFSSSLTCKSMFLSLYFDLILRNFFSTAENRCLTYFQTSQFN